MVDGNCASRGPGIRHEVPWLPSRRNARGALQPGSVWFHALAADTLSRLILIVVEEAGRGDLPILLIHGNSLSREVTRWSYRAGNGNAIFRHQGTTAH